MFRVFNTIPYDLVHVYLVQKHYVQIANIPYISEAPLGVRAAGAGESATLRFDKHIYQLRYFITQIVVSQFYIQ